MRKKKGRLIVGYGPMGGGKTEWLISHVTPETVVFVPDIDSRSNGSLKSHNGSKVTTNVVVLHRNNPQEAVDRLHGKQYSRLVFDEVNFYDHQLVHVIQTVVELGYRVYAAGLLLDSDKNDFGPTRELVVIADQTKPFFARCDYGVNGSHCKDRAVYNYFKGKKNGQVVVGAFDLYGCACEGHYEALRQHYLPTPVRTDKRPLRHRRRKYRYPRIEVGADSMRVGKTTAVEVLAHRFSQLGLPVLASYEEWQLNPYLKQSYQDPSEGLLNSQQWFLEHKYQQILSAPKDVVFIQDLPPEMDYGYAVANRKAGRMKLSDFEQYHQYSMNFDWSLIEAPDLLVYLTVSDGVLMERATKAARNFESVDTSYFFALKEVNRAWLSEIRHQWHVIEVNTDRLDFAHIPQDRQVFVDMVIKELHVPLAVTD